MSKTVWIIGQFELVRYDVRDIYANKWTFFYLLDHVYPVMDYRHSTLVGSL